MIGRLFSSLIPVCESTVPKSHAAKTDSKHIHSGVSQLRILQISLLSFDQLRSHRPILLNVIVHEALLSSRCLRLARLEDQLAKIVLIKRPMRFGGLIKRKAPRDMDLEWRLP
jgi:hypothetical protein